MAIPTVKVIIEAIDKASGEFEKVGKSSVGLKEKLFAIGKAVAAIGGAFVVGAFFKKAVTGAMEAEREFAQLTATVNSTGGAAGFTAEQLKAQADALSRLSTRASGEIQGGLGRLLTYTGIQGEMFEKASLAALDMATFLGVDVSTAAEKVGNALQYPSLALGSLSKQGFRFTEEQKQLIHHFEATGQVAKAQQIILDELTLAYGGSAAAAAQTFSGRLTQMRNEWGNVADAVGAAIIGNDNLGGSLGRITGLLVEAEKWISLNSGSIDEFVGGVVSLTEAVVKFVVWAGGKLSLLFELVAVDIVRAGAYFDLWGANARKAIAVILDAIGSLAEKGGAFLRKFGIQVSEDFGKKLRDSAAEFGRQADANLDAAKAVLSEVTAESVRHRREEEANSIAHAEKVAAINKERAAAVAATQEGERKAVAEAQAKMREYMTETTASTKKQADEIFAKINTTIGEMIPPVIVSTTKSIAELRAAGETAMDASRIVEWHDRLDQTSNILDPISGQYYTLSEYAKLVATRSKDAAEANLLTFDAVKNVAQGALGVASSFGVISKEAEGALNNVIGIADKLPAVLTGDPSAIFAVAGSLGSVLTTVFGTSAEDKKRQEALKKNTDWLKELATVNKGLLQLSGPGAAAGSIRDAIAAGVLGLKNGRNQSKSDAEAMLLASLQNIGVTKAQFDQVVKSAGIDMNSASAWDDLLKALNILTGSVFGTGFQGELERIDRVEAATGDDSGRFNAIAAALQQFAGASVAGLFQGDVMANLQRVITSMSPQEILAMSGGVSPAEFLDSIQDLIELLRGDAGGTSVTDVDPPVVAAPSSTTDTFPDIPTVTAPSFGGVTDGQGLPAGSGGSEVHFNGDINIHVGHGSPSEAQAAGAAAAEGFLQAIDEGLGREHRIQLLLNGRAVLP